MVFFERVNLIHLLSELFSFARTDLISLRLPCFRIHPKFKYIDLLVKFLIHLRTPSGVLFFA